MALEQINAPVTVIEVWTIQMAQWRVAKEKNIHLLDITAKSGEPAFAPDFGTVFRFKRGECSEVEYTAEYLERMRKSFKCYREYWNMLKDYPKVALACYCPAGAYCHRLLFKDMMTKFLTREGFQVIDRGELQ